MLSKIDRAARNESSLNSLLPRAKMDVVGRIEKQIALILGIRN